MKTLDLLRLEMLPVLRRLPAYSRLGLALMREPALKKRHKALLLGGVAYLLSPIDLIPGVIPVLGQLDDLAIALWSLRAVLRAAPRDVADRLLDAQGLTRDLLDGDLRSIGRSGRLLTRAGFRIGRWALEGVGRTVWLLAQRLLRSA